MKDSITPLLAFCATAALSTAIARQRDSSAASELTNTHETKATASTSIATETSTTAAAQTTTDSISAGSEPKYQVVFVLGGPGAGKGTQCEKLVTEFQGAWGHLSAGDLLRAERKSGSSLATLINDCISAGKIVPSEITATLLQNAMDAACKNQGTTKFLIDGFPRSQGNVTAWEEKLGQTGIAKVEFVLFLDCPEDIMTSRLLERGLTSGRNDDNLEVIRKRFATFRDESMPIVAAYENENKVRHVVADRSIDAVYADVITLFKGL
mmetsp:Transcript_9348/g.13853  ORF Transcript_9348/g.13853 Transcript_9348/m.13853 type:complete len:267 (-) Transcript_9348:207-1007(-)|eukprot:CAMPEP_0196816726 /NCGR_PEP_ID=MMETSP1362-20130617/56878_1 /TAXON_ID=163516 /ORGANISM="Leptocylindrus danicus, Strain CCMP1856" /LENGTH=266 /DNA_ID=CAMNT_0042194173 /DNA_START=76 /DNA_END=876 /DNA_ORIENTATION=-